MSPVRPARNAKPGENILPVEHPGGEYEIAVPLHLANATEPRMREDKIRRISEAILGNGGEPHPDDAAVVAQGVLDRYDAAVAQAQTGGESESRLMPAVREHVSNVVSQRIAAEEDSLHFQRGCVKVCSAFSAFAATMVGGAGYALRLILRDEPPALRNDPQVISDRFYAYLTAGSLATVALVPGLVSTFAAVQAARAIQPSLRSVQANRALLGALQAGNDVSIPVASEAAHRAGARIT